MSIPEQVRVQRRRAVAALVSEHPHGLTLAEVMARTGLPRYEAEIRLVGAVNTGLLTRTRGVNGGFRKGFIYRRPPE